MAGSLGHNARLQAVPASSAPLSTCMHAQQAYHTEVLSGLVALASSAAVIRAQEPLGGQHTMHLQHLVNAHVYIEASLKVSLEQANSACSSQSINKLNFCRRVLFPWTCTQGPAHSLKLQCCLNAYLLGHHTKELVTYCGCAACSLTSCPNVCMQMLLGPLP